MVNRKCIDLALPFPAEVIMHDWWLALIASYLGEISYIHFLTPVIDSMIRM